MPGLCLLLCVLWLRPLSGLSTRLSAAKSRGKMSGAADGTYVIAQSTWARCQPSGFKAAFNERGYCAYAVFISLPNEVSITPPLRLN